MTRTLDTATPPPTAQAVLAGLEQDGQLSGARALILAEADRLGVGPLSEVLKWGQPAYLTEATKAGTTIRLGLHGGAPALFVHCQTSIIEDARSVFGTRATFFGNRGILLGSDPDAVRFVIGAALTYHRKARL